MEEITETFYITCKNCWKSGESTEFIPEQEKDEDIPDYVCPKCGSYKLIFD